MTTSAAPGTMVPLTPRAQMLIGGKYRLEGELGSGAMGTVWLATHTSLGQQVAIKFISKQLVQSAQARLRFETEARSAAMLRSRFAVQVHDIGETEEGVPYIVMEYLHGETLEQALKQRGPMPLADAVRMIWQVARALSRAHALSIIHRDLKPANIFLAQIPDEGEVAKVLDFGVAKVAGATASQFATQTGALVGTPLFMSPEQLRGLKEVDHRSDLFSLGMVAYNALTGREAVAHDTLAEVVLAICIQPLPSLTVAAPWLPPAMNDWFQRACAREPADRFQSADELAKALLVASGLSAASVDNAQTADTAARVPVPVPIPAEMSTRVGHGFAPAQSSVQAVSEVLPPEVVRTPTLVAQKPKSALPWLVAGALAFAVAGAAATALLVVRSRSAELHPMSVTSERMRESLARAPVPSASSPIVQVVPSASAEAPPSTTPQTEPKAVTAPSSTKPKPKTAPTRGAARPKKKPIDVGF